MAEKTKLLTQFLTVATAGATIDGREISEQDLAEIVETYDASEYTALINFEHYRSMNYLGSVEAVRLSKDDKNRTTLQAQISPTNYAIRMNKEGDAQFTSIEIIDDYAKTGKAGLGGLALTNSPASLGTDRLQFNSSGTNERYSPPHFINVFSMQTDDPANTDEARFTAWFKKMFSTHTPNAETDHEQDDDMKQEDITALATEIGKQFSSAIEPIAQQLETQGAALAKFTDEQQEQEPDGSESGTNTGAEDEQESDLQKKYSKLEADHKNLVERFNKAIGESSNETLDDEDAGESEKFSNVC